MTQLLSSRELTPVWMQNLWFMPFFCALSHVVSLVSISQCWPTNNVFISMLIKLFHLYVSFNSHALWNSWARYYLFVKEINFINSNATESLYCIYKTLSQEAFQLLDHSFTHLISFISILRVSEQSTDS